METKSVEGIMDTLKKYRSNPVSLSFLKQHLNSNHQNGFRIKDQLKHFLI